MAVLYTSEGRKHIVHHPIDIRDALATGNYFLENPVKPKVEIPKSKEEPKILDVRSSKKERDA